MGITVLVALLSMPSVAAVSVEGHLLVEGPARFPTGSVLQVTPLALLNNETSSVTLFNLQAESMWVTMYEDRTVGIVGTLGAYIESTVKTWKQTDVELSLLDAGEHDGYFGIKAYKGAHMEATLLAPYDLESREESTISNGVLFINPTSDSPAFHERISGPHLYTQAQASIAYQGSGMVHVNGLDFVLNAAENETSVDWRTGHVQVSPVEFVQRWFVFEAQDALIRLVPGHMMELAGTDGGASWQGEALMTPVSGTLRSPEGTYHPSGERAKLDGRFTAHMLPADVSDHIQFSNVRGEVQTTDLHFQPAPFASIQNAAWLPWAALAVVATAGTSIGAVLWRRVERMQPTSWDEYLNNVGICFQGGMYERALAWARQGRAFAPGIVSFIVYEAKCLAAMGQVEGAVKAYADAHKMAPHGDYALDAARLLRDDGWSCDKFEPWLVAALEKSPEELLEIEQEFPEVVNRPSWRVAARIAQLHSR